MKRSIVFLHIILAYFSLGCSDIKHTPSAVVLKHFESKHGGDIPLLRSTMTREAYLALVTNNISRLQGEGKVFDYDKAHYLTDPVSLGRLEVKLSDYLKTTSRPSIALISENAIDESSREIYLELNGKRETVLLVDIDSQWRIAHLPGE